MARKQFNYIVTTAGVTIQKLAYADMDSEATVAETLEFAVADIPAELTNGDAELSLAAYGLSQVLQDRVSGVDAEDRFAEMSKVFELLKEGQWKAARASGGGVKKATIDSYFASGFAAFLQSQGKDVDANTATIILQGMEAEQRKALRADDRIKPFIQKAKDNATDAAAQLDLSDLLG